MTTSSPKPRLSIRVRLIRLKRRLLPSINLERRGVVQVQLREASHPDFDFFLLTVLSCVIATQGLLVDSPAIIIGAMLVAPLMSPIIGLGLASITGDGRLLRDGASALVRGALLAVLISFLLAYSNRFLPFVALQELPGEVLARTHPGPIDLGVALAGGLAAAFALAMPHISAALPGVAIATALMPPLCTVGIGLAMNRWDVAGGASLLFLTNAVTITFAASLVFFILGFSPGPVKNTGRLPRSLLVSAFLTATLLGPLSYLSYQFVSSATENRDIEVVLKEEVGKMHNAELVEWSVISSGDSLDLKIIVRTVTLMRYEDSVALQIAIADRLQRPVSIIVNQVFAAHLDPLVPPTYTSTPTTTSTPTPGPSPTPTNSPTPIPTTTATATETATFIPTLTPTSTSTPTPTPTNTPTPAMAQAFNVYMPGLRLRQWPEGPFVGPLMREGSSLTVLYGYEIVNGLVWVEVRDAEGRVGWVPQMYLTIITPTSMNTALLTATDTPTPLPTPSPSLIAPTITASLTPSHTSAP